MFFSPLPFLITVRTKVDEIFVSYEELKAKFGKDEFNLSTITRGELMSLTEECESVTGIPYVMRAYRKEAEKIPAQ